MPYFSIPNHVTRDIKRTYDDPLVAAQDAVMGRPSFKDKEERRKWLAKPDTNTAILSLYEGLNPDLRVSLKEGNPVALVHGILVDYDAAAPGSLADIVKHIEDFYKDTPALRPQWLVVTPSGHYRLVWEFAEPCSLRGTPDKFPIGFLQEFRKLVRLSSVLAGLDEAAYLKPSTYYDAEGIWERVSPDPFPVVEVDGVFFGAAKKVNGSELGGITEIPMEAIKERIEEVFPGRWPVDVPFVDGCRGPAVWDPNSTNPTTTIYRTTGAWRFSSDKGFHGYAEILGRDFVRQWEDNKLGQATKNFYYCPHGSKNYYVKIGGSRGTWEPQGLGDVHRRLVSGWGLNRKTPAATSVSELDLAIQHIQDHKKVDSIIPFVFNKKDVVEVANHRYLNCARVRVMEPEPEQVNNPNIAYGKRNLVQPGRKHVYPWGAGFPWIAEWLFSLFPLGAPRKQVVYLLCWIKQAYESARAGDPAQGQALFLVGGVGVGKTFFNSVFMDEILGGTSVASDYLLGETKFNKELLESGFWTVDDSKAAQDVKDHQRFTEGIKAFVANPKVLYQPKYVDSVSVPYNGRVCITLNEDERSLRMIPDLSRNIADKLIILRLAEKRTFQFHRDAAINRKTVRQQLPHFLRWLINWTPPEHILRGHDRFGMKSFIHRKVRNDSLTSGIDSDILDIMAPLWSNDDEFVKLRDSGGAWSGSAADLYSVMISNPLTMHLIKSQTPRSIGRKLSLLATIPGSGVTRGGDKTRFSTYTIEPPSALRADEDSPDF
jgi:hypothetical protein